MINDGTGYRNPTPTVGDYPGTIGLDVTTPLSGPTISIRLNSTADVSQWNLQCIGVDDLSHYPTLTSVNATTNQVTSPASIVTFVYPAVLGTAFGFRSTIVGSGGSSSITFAIYAKTANGDRVGFAGETREGNTTYGWTTKINPVIRLLGNIQNTGPDNFTYNHIGDGQTITIPAGQQMLAIGGVDVEGTLNIDGELVLLEM